MSQLKVNSIIPLSGAPSGGGGGIIQVIQSLKSDTFSDTSNGSEIALTGISVTIQPKSSSSKILLICSLFYCCVGTTYKMYPKRGSTVVGVGDASSNRPRVQGGLGHTHDNNQCDQCTTFWMDSPNTTSSTTYSFHAVNDNDVPLYINRSVHDYDSNVGQRGISTVTAMEVTG